MEEKECGMEKGDMVSRGKYCTMVTPYVNIQVERKWTGVPQPAVAWTHDYCRKVTDVSSLCVCSDWSGSADLQSLMQEPDDASRHPSSDETTAARASPEVDYSWTLA